MTTRIDVLVFWAVTLCSAVCNGQNFERLLTTRDYGAVSRTSEAYRAGVRDEGRDVARTDYEALRAQVSQRYADEFQRSLPSPPQNFERRYQQYRPFTDWDRSPDADGPREGSWYRRDLRPTDDYRYTRPRARCENGECWQGELQSIGYDFSPPTCSGYGVSPTSFYDVPPTLPPRRSLVPNDYRSYRQNVDRSGNYVSDNLYGEPRVFNPDQPVRNLLRYVFP